MYIKPILKSKNGLEREELRADKEACRKFGSCGVGKKAVYLGTASFDRIFYIPIESIDRVYKRVAITKGGYTGKGAYASLAYFVVIYDSGIEFAVSIKDEDIVDDIIECIHSQRPDIPTMSSAAEVEYKNAQALKKAFVYPEISQGQMDELMLLKSAKDYLEKNPSFSDELSRAAKEKRLHGKLEKKHRAFAGLVYMMGLVAALIGVNYINKGSEFEFWFAPFAIGLLFVIIASRIVPTAKRNVYAILDAYDKAVFESGEYIKKFDGEFPVIAEYAHPVVIERMCEAIRRNRAKDSASALDIVKEDLRKLNRSVTVDQEEFEQVVVVKPLFLVAEYK